MFIFSTMHSQAAYQRSAVGGGGLSTSGQDAIALKARSQAASQDWGKESIYHPAPMRICWPKEIPLGTKDDLPNNNSARINLGNCMYVLSCEREFLGELVLIFLPKLPYLNLLRINWAILSSLMVRATERQGFGGRYHFVALVFKGLL